jgi:hypothetical protein
LFIIPLFTHGLRRGLHSFAASRLKFNPALAARLEVGALSKLNLATSFGTLSFAQGRPKT